MRDKNCENGPRFFISHSALLLDTQSGPGPSHEDKEMYVNDNVFTSIHVQKYETDLITDDWTVQGVHETGNKGQSP